MTLLFMALYNKVMNRSLSLLACEYWDKGEREAMQDICDGVFFADPFFLSRSQEGVGVFYNWVDPRQDPRRLVEYFNAHPESYDALEKEYLDRCERILSLAREINEKTFKILFDEVVLLWPMGAICKLLGNWGPALHDDIRKRCFETREKTDRVYYQADNAMMTFAALKFGEASAPYLLSGEILGDVALAPEDIARRKEGFVYYQGVLATPPSGVAYAFEHDVELVQPVLEQGIQEYKGQSASSGKVRGMVRVVFERSQIGKVQAGDILVSPMTTPDFMPAIVLAAALVTEEGGITCHAAIVARELKKPCVIGVKTATRVLKDGDEVEVDADNGTVTIVRRA